MWFLGWTQSLTVGSLSFSGCRKLPVSWQASQNQVQGRRGACGHEVPPGAILGLCYHPRQCDMASRQLHHDGPRGGRAAGVGPGRRPVDCASLAGGLWHLRLHCQVSPSGMRVGRGALAEWMLAWRFRDNLDFKTQRTGGNPPYVCFTVIEIPPT